MCFDAGPGKWIFWAATVILSIVTFYTADDHGNINLNGQVAT